VNVDPRVPAAIDLFGFDVNPVPTIDRFHQHRGATLRGERRPVNVHETRQRWG
jgi:hypothetical protein